MSVAAVEQTEPVVALRARPLLSGTWLLAGAMVASGVLTYAFLVLAARALGPYDYGQIGVLWGSMFIGAIVLFRPLEQTTSRAIADRLTRGEEVATVLRSVGLICAVLVGAGAIAAAAAWGVLTRRLFHGDDLLTAMLVAGTAAYGLQYLARGLLGGVRWFKGYSLGLLADASARLLLAAPLVVFASRGLAAAALVGAGLAGAVVPLLIGRRRLRGIAGGGGGTQFHIRSAAAFAAPATAIAAADQMLVNGGPLLVVAGGASAKAAGVVFAATMLVRAPVYVFQGVAASLLPNLTRLQADPDGEPFRRAIIRAAVVLLSAGVAIVSMTAVLGPRAMALYGSGFEAGRAELVMLAIGVACYLAAGTFSQALLSLDGGLAAAAAWSVAAGAMVAAYAAAPGSPLERVSSAFAAAMIVGTVLLGVLLARKVRRR